MYKLKNISSETTLTGMSAFNIRLKKGEHGYLYIPGTEPDTVTINGQEQKSDYWNNNFLDLGTYDTETIVHVTAGSGVHEAVLGTYQETELDKIYEKLSAEQADLTSGTSSISVNQDGMFMISCFYDPDVRIYVDGKEAVTQSLQGLTEVKLSAGTHTVEMKYETPGLKVGAVLSILILIMMGISNLGWMRKKRSAILSDRSGGHN